MNSNFDRLYNKRIDFDREAAQQRSIEEKGDYLDAQLRRRAQKTSLPPPEQISKHLQVIDQMR